MEPNESAKVIAAAGGDAAFAKMIGLDPTAKGICQRVNNWKRRGIPATVVLENLKTIRQLEKQAAANADGQAVGKRSA